MRRAAPAAACSNVHADAGVRVVEPSSTSRRGSWILGGSGFQRQGLRLHGRGHLRSASSCCSSHAHLRTAAEAYSTWRHRQCHVPRKVSLGCQDLGAQLSLFCLCLRRYRFRQEHVWLLLEEFRLLDADGLPLLLRVGNGKQLVWADSAFLVLLRRMATIQRWDDLVEECSMSRSLLSWSWQWMVQYLHDNFAE